MEDGENQLVRDMTYKVEQFVKKITSPITVTIGENSIAFQNGEKLAEASFCEPVKIESITAQNDIIIIQLAKNDSVNDMSWSDKDNSYF